MESITNKLRQGQGQGIDRKEWLTEMHHAVTDELKEVATKVVGRR